MKHNRHFEYMCCPKCGRHLMSSDFIYLNLGNIVMCCDCADDEEFFDCCLTVKEYVEQPFMKGGD